MYRGLYGGIHAAIIAQAFVLVKWPHDLIVLVAEPGGFNRRGRPSTGSGQAPVAEGRGGFNHRGHRGHGGERGMIGNVERGPGTV